MSSAVTSSLSLEDGRWEGAVRLESVIESSTLMQPEQGEVDTETSQNASVYILLIASVRREHIYIGRNHL